MMARWLPAALILALAGCSLPHHAVTSLGPPVPPVILQTCPTAPPPPAPPAPPRTIESLLNWAISDDRARSETGSALAECADRIYRLNDWMAENTVLRGSHHARPLSGLPPLQPAAGK